MSSDDQEDVSSPYEAGPLRPLGPLRGRENWYTRDHIKALQRADLSAQCPKLLVTIFRNLVNLVAIFRNLVK